MAAGSYAPPLPPNGSRRSGTLAGTVSMTGKTDGPMENSYWVIPGRLAAGEYPGHPRAAVAARKLRTLLQAGIGHFIDLTEEDEGLEPYAEIATREAARLDSEVVHARHAIVDMSVPASPRETAGILDAIDAALDDDGTVYLHCWGGAGRTGTVLGCWLVRHGSTGEEALARIADWWRGVDKAYRLPHSPQTAQQCAYVRNWAEPAGESPE